MPQFADSPGGGQSGADGSTVLARLESEAAATRERLARLEGEQAAGSVALAAIASHLARLADRVDPTPADGLVGTNYLHERLGISVRWACQLAENGTVPPDCIAVRGGDGRQWRFYKDKLDAWLRVYMAENPGRRQRRK